MTAQDENLSSYQKPWKSYEEQISLLESRGLVIEDLLADPPPVQGALARMGIRNSLNEHPLWNQY